MNNIPTVSAQKIKVNEMLDYDQLHIPEYQRPYRWTEKNVIQLLQDVNDARLNGKQDYLIGSVILHRNDGRLDIVDGQQRLTTICLIVKVFTETKHKLPSFKYNHTDSFRHIKENHDTIKKWKDQNIPTVEQSIFIDYLLNSCLFVQITVSKLNEAFQLFETQNGRGKPLEVYNLLKAYHIRAMTDALKQDKIDCDVRWEDAASYFALGGERYDLLRQVINEHLYRTRVWSRGHRAKEFKRQDVDEFKGLTIGKDTSVEFTYQNGLLQQQIALALIQNLNMGLFKIKSRFEHGDPENMSPFVNINQLIINGKSFFDYVETYVEIYKRIFIQTDSSQLANFKKFYNEYCKGYKGHWRSGDTYIRQVYKSAIILTFDKFGERGVNYLYESLYLCLYRYRLENSQVKYTTMVNNSSKIFTIIHHAKNLLDLNEIKRIGEDNRNNKRKFLVEKIIEFFDKKS